VQAALLQLQVVLLPLQLALLQGQAWASSRREEAALQQ